MLLLPPLAGKHRQDCRCLQRTLSEGRATGRWRVQGAEGGRGERGKAALLLAFHADRRAPPSALRAASPTAQGKRKRVFQFFHSLSGILRQVRGSRPAVRRPSRNRGPAADPFADPADRHHTSGQRWNSGARESLLASNNLRMFTGACTCTWYGYSRSQRLPDRGRRPVWQGAVHRHWKPLRRSA